MKRRDALRALGLLLTSVPLDAAPAVSTVIGTGSPGHSDREVNNPYGVVVARGALYFCDLDNQRIRRLDLETGRTTTIAGNGERGYSGDGGPATAPSLNMPHEIQFDLRGDLYLALREGNAISPQRNEAMRRSF